MSIIAIDSGGAKARFALYDLNGVLLEAFESLSLHPLQVGFAQMAKGLRRGVDELIARCPSSIKMISFGLAGYGEDTKIRHKIEKAIQAEFSESYVIHNDVECALMAALQEVDGILLAAGMGSIALRSLNHQLKRCGGWGHLIGDEGSAYYLGAKVLELFSKMADERKAKSAIYDLVMDALVMDDPSEIINHLNSSKNPKEAISSLAKIVFLAAEKNDKIALNLFKKAAIELAACVKALSYESIDKIPVRCVGGVFESKDMILRPLIEELGDKFDVSLSDKPPIYGAYLYAKKEMEK